MGPTLSDGGIHRFQQFMPRVREVFTHTRSYIYNTRYGPRLCGYITSKNIWYTERRSVMDPIGLVSSRALYLYRMTPYLLLASGSPR